MQQSYLPNQDFQKVEFFIACRNLIDKDVFSKSDPYVVFLMKDLTTGKYKEISRTEQIKDNLNPNFTKSFLVDYIFEVNQECRFEVRDDDEGTYEDLGSVNTTVGALVGARNQTSILDLEITQTKKRAGQLICRVEQVQESRDFYFMKWAGQKLKNVDGWFDKSDPFLRFSRMREDKSFVLIHETEHIMDNLDPIWQPFEISGQQLANGDIRKLIKVECWDWEKSGQPQFIGEAHFTLTDIIHKEVKTFTLLDAKKKESGTLRLEQFSVQTRPTFLDYISGGVQLNLILAVDFTGSNGQPNTPSSLHYFNPANPLALNCYQNAILSVGNILLNYDFDQNVPCYGFGALTKYPNFRSNTVQHCFPLSGDVNNPEAKGLDEVMNVYSYALRNVDLSGPTYFGPIIEQTIKVSQVCQQQGSGIYNIMLILTDGAIHDMDKTIDNIVYASDLPLSIIIVGIGNAQFSSMVTLDGDSGLVSGKGRQATRDLVQFVPFRDVGNNPFLLAQQVLAQVPDQVCQYYRMAGILPRPPVVVDINAMQIDQSMKAPPPAPAPAPTYNQPPPSNYNQPPPNYNQQPQSNYNQPPPAPNYNPAPPQSNPYGSMYAPPPTNFGSVYSPAPTNLSVSHAPPQSNQYAPPPQQNQNMGHSLNPYGQKEGSAPPPNPLLGSHK